MRYARTKELKTSDYVCTLPFLTFSFLNDVKKWAKYFIKKRGKISNSYVEELLVNMAGDSLMHLDNEVEKICLIIGDRNNIEAEDIQHFSGWKRDRQRWEFLLALGNRNYSKSISLGRSIINKSESMLSLLIPLTALFQEMLFYKLKNGTLNDFSGFYFKENLCFPLVCKRKHA